MHIDVCHTLFSNAADANRLLALQQRRGVTLTPRRFEWPNLAIEHADCATMLGNQFTADTFKYAQKPIYRVPMHSNYLYPPPETKDFEACRRSYLYFGNSPLARKGLDLVLEAFAGLPEYRLIVVSPVDQEDDFRTAYHKELYEFPNIRSIEWVDLSTPTFAEIANQCLGTVYPSAAEGQCASVILCLHAGLIPIISYESGVDVFNFGVILPDCSIEEIRKNVRMISSRPLSELKTMAKGAWDFARANHTQERYAAEYRRAIEKIIEHHGKQ